VHNVCQVAGAESTQCAIQNCAIVNAALAVAQSTIDCNIDDL